MTAVSLERKCELNQVKRTKSSLWRKQAIVKEVELELTFTFGLSHSSLTYSFWLNFFCVEKLNG
jgi:hypothetical protein